ncbi:hypothetical protein OMR58_07355 [Erwinia sp. INIA-01]|nr:hypothetical protein [Erwinia sp. INIA01]MCW1874263.1 hypothetical protein [Erwinia sp. INIA01]
MKTLTAYRVSDFHAKAAVHIIANGNNSQCHYHLQQLWPNRAGNDQK